MTIAMLRCSTSFGEALNIGERRTKPCEPTMLPHDAETIARELLSTH